MSEISVGGSQLSALTFADIYKGSGFAMGPEIIERRTTAFENLRKLVTPKASLELTLLYFGRPVPGGPQWLVDGLVAADPSFSVVEADRELAIFASCLLGAALDDRKPVAGLAPLAASFAGTRFPIVRPDFIETVRAALRVMAAEGRRALVDIAKLGGTPNTQDVGPVDDWTKTATALKQVSDDAAKAAARLTRQTSEALQALQSQVSEVREEVDMVAWLIGGWSEVLDKPFSALDLPVAVAAAAFDLAKLTRRLPGPVAAQALLQRCVSTGREKPQEVTLTQVVTSCPSSLRRAMVDDKNPRALIDVYPVLASIQLAEEIGNDAWLATLKKASAWDPGRPISDADLAMQVYRESLVLGSVN